MSDEGAHRKKEAEKAKGETWSQTQKAIEEEMSDEETRHKKETKKAKERLDEERLEGKYQQIKPVLRYPCDACKHVSKTTDQLKKHMIIFFYFHLCFFHF